MAGKNEIKEEYTSSLADLTFNSKPLISVLTMLAEEYIAHAKDIVEAIEAHLSRVRTEVKLPVLYLIDSIIKNLGGPYTTLFCQNIVSTFCTVFEQVDERTRAEMFRLRQTWNDVIPPKKLYSLDIQIKELDPAWPVTAPPPSNIHFNPKFFKSNTTSALTKIKNTTPNMSVSKSDLLLPNTNNALDEKTLTMQQKLIDKQRQLLELQQRKLELELLQTQVKLQEQLKTTSTAGGPTGTTTTTSTVGAPSKNLLLKPEVAKQLSIPTNQTKLSPAIRSKSGPHTVSSVMNARLNQGNSSYPTSRITPVQSNLAKARPPIRDPRLLRHQQHEQQQQQFQTAQQIAPNSKTNNNTNVHLENKSKSLVNNKGNIESHGKSKTLPHSSPLKHTQKIGSLPRKAAKFLQVNKSPGSSSTVNINAADLKGSSSSSLSSSSKSSSKSDSSLKKRSTGKSSIKSKKKRTESAITESGAFSNKESTLLRYNKGDKSASVPFHSDKDSSVILNKKIAKHSSNKSELKDKSQLSKSENASFKDLKGLTKNRNYMRRNRNTSVSPELNQDVDLRLGVPPEKQPRLQSDIMEDKHVVIEGSNDVAESKDVDLRLFNPPMAKKRTSEDSNESPNSKKSKTKMFDVLFGSEDIDLRQLPPPVVLSPKGSDRPPTPPPPIISENNKSSEIPVDKIIISPADEECIKTGNMTEAQKNALMNKIIAQIEGQKLREAKRKDTESSKQTINISLQPISDDELEADFSGDESTKTDNKRIISPNNRVLHEDESVYDNRLRDREDRMIPQQSQSEEPFNKYSRGMDHRDSRSNRLWRGGRFRQKVWDNPLTGPIPRPPIPPLLRPGPPDLWVRQMNDWRGMCPPTGPMFQQNFSPDIPNNMPPHLMNQEGGHSPNSNFHDIPSLEYSPPNSFTFITIDHEPREVRYYDEIAIVFMSAGDPREIAFHDGMRRIFFDGEPHLLKFNHSYEDILIKGKIHKVRLGTPSREIFIDGKGYQCYFDGNEKTIELDGNTVMVKLELPPPRVNIGQEKRLDLVAGKIQLVVDAKNITTIFLDGKLQTFEVDGVEHTLKFVDALRGVLIDGTRYDIEFGGLPKPFMFNDKKHFIRFSVLPKGVKPGRVCIKDMEVCQPYDSPKNDTESSQDGFSNLIVPVDMAGSTKNQSNSLGSHSPERNSNSPCSQNIMQQQNFNNLDMLSSVLSSSMISSSADGGYNVENSIHTDSSQNIQTNSTNIPVASVQQSSVKPAININELFQRLVATGIVTTSAPTSQPEQTPIYAPPHKPSRNIINFKQVKPVDFSKPETLKLRRVAIIQALHIGMQCSSCGMRFPPEQSMYYSQHLDWHFRQNRKGKRNIRKASNRRWYYNFSDWKNYEELENLEEREKSYFENQQASQNEASNEDGEEDIEIPCVPADPNVQNAVCEVCQDKFEQFYNEEKDEWQLRMAIRMDDKTYHPLCYEDYQSSFMDETIDDNKTDLITEHETNLSSGGIPLLEVPNKESFAKDNENVENDVDDVMEVIENIDDDEDDDGSLKEENKFEEMPPEDDDDDVILNEVIPERIVVDDDDKDDYEPSNHDNTFIPEIVIKEEPIDDGFMDIGIDVVKTKTDIVKIKTEPLDTYEPEPETLAVDSADTTHIEVVSSMDGNVELDMGVPTSSGLSGKIKINISKPIPTIVQKENKGIVNEELNIDSIDPSQPLPPGEEPVQLNVKPALKGLELKRQPVVKKGSELTGLCSIM